MLSEMFEPLLKNPPCRVLAFGSSNTERLFCGMHWFDCFDLAVGEARGRVHRCINTGIGGHSTRDLLARFDEDAAFYRPHLAFITIGGNDSNSDPQVQVPVDEFRENLHRLIDQFREMDTRVVLQTYYAMDIEAAGFGERIRRCEDYMQVVREVAAEADTGLIDHLARWLPFRDACREQYLPLMHDPLHLNRRGNMVMGLDIARAFGLPLGATEEPDFWQPARDIQATMDRLAGAE